jgi:MMP 1-O-methyltransferase
VLRADGLTPHSDLDQVLGMLRPDEGARLAWLAAQVPADQAIVEIGSFKGKSACYLSRGSAAGNGAHVFCVDLWDLGGQRQGKRWRYDAAATFETFKAQVAEHGVAALVTPIKGASADVAATWDRPVGLLWVDGLHTYDGVRADIEAWTPHVAEGGWVAFHDYCDREPGVMKAVDEWTSGRVVTKVDRVVAVQTSSTWSAVARTTRSFGTASAAS